MLSSITLSYARHAPPSNDIKGTLQVNTDEPEAQPVYLLEFSCLDLVQAFTRLAEQVRDHSAESESGSVALPQVVIIRTDVPSAVPIELEPAAVEGLRTDLTSVLRGLQPEERIMRLKRRPIEVEPASGWDVFGYRVYLRRRGELVESPVDGRWKPIDKSDARDMWEVEVEGYVDALPLRITAHVGWASVFVEDLLRLGLKRYYLPRAWNTRSAWISHQDLNDRYEKYKETL